MNLSASIWQVFSSDWRCYTFANKCSWLLFTFLSWFWSCAPVHSRLGGCEARRVRSGCSRSTLIKTSGEWMEHSTESPILFNFCYFCLSLSKVVFVLFQKLADFCHRFRLQYFLLWWYHHTFYKDKIWQILDWTMLST